MSLELLARMALLGTERAPAPPLAAELMALAVADDPPRSLLRQAAWCGLSERAGWMPSKPVTGMPACAAETLPSIVEQSAFLLLEVLAREDADLLRECLQAVVAHGLRLNERMLPRMLGHYTDPRQRALVIEAGGAMAQWLVRLNPEWAVSIGDGGESDWTDGNQAQRADFLRAERARDPAAARARLQPVFAAETPAARVEFLGAMATGLGPDDEEFLEAAKDDKRKEVRRAAIELLRQLPQAQLAERAWVLVQPLLVGKPGGWLRKAALEVRLPEACTPAMQRDGIDPKPPTHYKGGERSFWLEELLAQVPPQRWAAAFDMDAATLWALVEKHEFSETLRRGWLRAAIAFAELEWAQLGLGQAALLQADDQLARTLAQRIAAAADGERRVGAHLRAHPGESPDLWLAALPSPWSAEFSQQLVTWLRARWNAHAAKGREYLMYSTLKLAAHHLDLTDALDEFGWSADREGRTQRVLAEFFATHGLRRSFLLSLQQDRS